MTGDEYQVAAARTLISRPDFEPTPEELMIVWTAVGMAGEAGEVVELIKKGVFHRKGIDRAKLTSELGDVLWYIAGICTTTGISLSDVMAANDAKLRARYPNGWDNTRSHGAGQAPAEVTR